MRVLVLGSGGREHALAWKLAQSKQCTKIFVAPGNDGIKLSGIETFDFKSLAELKQSVRDREIDLIVPGSEKYLADDIANFDFGTRVKVFGPTAKLAQLETSKAWAKKVLIDAKIPTAQYFLAQSRNEALSILKKENWDKGVVIKFDGLAAGKGVVVCNDSLGGIQAVEELSQNYGEKLVIEERLQGPEFSAFAVVHKNNFVKFGSACDYKRRTADPESPNTGGMGAYSPCDWTDQSEVDEVVWKPLFAHLNKLNLVYNGFIYAGLMKTKMGLKVIEFNVRLGDPETQALLPRLDSDLLELITNETLESPKFKTNESSVHVVLTHPLYPKSQMESLELPQQIMSSNSKSLKFFSAVKKTDKGWKTSGGRILGITALGSSRSEARELVFEEVKNANLSALSFREDVGL